MPSLFARFLAALLLALPALAQAAASALPVTPQNVAVLGGTTREFAVRFTDALGQPAAGENVQFVNDACGVFGNGSSVATVKTDAEGLATTPFTARNQGIVCYVIASGAGAAVRFEVITFTLAQMRFSVSTDPILPKPGAEFDLKVVPTTGVYRLKELEVSARVVAGSGSAGLSPTVRNSGQEGEAAFRLSPAGFYGDYEVELRFHDYVQRVPIKASATPWQDMWWAGSVENGWGMSVVQHGDTLFSLIYAYDAAGKPTWYVMPGGKWDAERRVYTGDLYAPHGSPYSSYRSEDFVVGAAAGRATLRFVDGSNAELEYSIGGTSGRKRISRQLFGLQQQPLAASFGDMWWGGESQNGWGIAVLQQYRTLFLVWFTYDASGAPTWFVMPDGSWRDAATFEGRVYRASGPAWLGKAYDASAFKTFDVGFFRIRFAGEVASFEYTIDGRSGTMPLTRQPF
jgi:hypothetical protein